MSATGYHKCRYCGESFDTVDKFSLYRVKNRRNVLPVTIFSDDVDIGNVCAECAVSVFDNDVVRGNAQLVSWRKERSDLPVQMIFDEIDCFEECDTREFRIFDYSYRANNKTVATIIGGAIKRKRREIKKAERMLEKALESEDMNIMLSILSASAIIKRAEERGRFTLKELAIVGNCSIGHIKKVLGDNPRSYSYIARNNFHELSRLRA